MDTSERCGRYSMAPASVHPHRPQEAGRDIRHALSLPCVLCTGAVRDNRQRKTRAVLEDVGEVPSPQKRADDEVIAADLPLAERKRYDPIDAQVLRLVVGAEPE